MFLSRGVDNVRGHYFQIIGTHLSLTFRTAAKHDQESGWRVDG
jgi:hypothetical protein